MTDEHALRPRELHARCDPASLGFETTAELEPFTGALGQDEAMASLAFGLEMGAGGFNLFVLGRPGSGRMTMVRQALRNAAASRPVPARGSPSRARRTRRGRSCPWEA